MVTICEGEDMDIWPTSMLENKYYFTLMEGRYFITRRIWEGFDHTHNNLGHYLQIFQIEYD